MDLAKRFANRSPLLIGALLAQLVVAIGVFLALSGGDKGGLTPLAQAAERTAEYPGGRMELTGSLEIPGSGALMTMTGEGEYNGKTGLSRITAGADLPPESAAAVPGGRIEMEQVAVARPGTLVVYQRSPTLGALPGGAEWMKLDLSEQAAAGAQSFDPREQLAMLRSTEDFERLGTESVRGVATTHYRATVDQGDELERLRDEGEDEAADLLETIIAANDGADTMPIEAWVARDQTIRRMRIEMPFSLGATPAGSTLLMTMELFDFGIEPHIELPSDSDAFDATEMAREELEELAD
jgi:hypothetical protein